ncbi:MAG: hypothetical protein RLZZ216_1774 [Cyanobacteriota bacterium]|jgi:hypothetical protein
MRGSGPGGVATRTESLGTSEKRMPINEVRQIGSATACVRSAESSIRDKLLAANASSFDQRKPLDY